MNELILKLATQAKLRDALMLEWFGKFEALTDSEQEGLKNLQKFAELVVKECISQMDEIGYGSSDEWDRALSFAQYMIKEHFGIEE